MDSTPKTLVARWLGRRSFDEVLAMQLKLREELVAGACPQTLLLVEHPPTLTQGRRAQPEDILWTPQELETAGVSVCTTPRGGETTLHAPGQLVAYPIVSVGRQIRAHVVRMGEVSAQLFGELGLDGCAFRMDHPGVWRGDAKIASIGIHISRGVAVQGTSLNIDVDSSMFAALVSCGLPQVEMVSAAAFVDSLPPMSALARRWAELFAEAAQLELHWESPPAG